jgi:uncharacterized membrane protein YeaQ/YmgE (transglycosylase-associated protein family)
MQWKRRFRRNQFWQILCGVLGAIVLACILPFWLVCAILGAAIAFAVCTLCNK